jgi:hypothetical protein
VSEGLGLGWGARPGEWSFYTAGSRVCPSGRWARRPPLVGGLGHARAGLLPTCYTG